MWTFRFEDFEMGMCFKLCFKKCNIKSTKTNTEKARAAASL